MPSWSVASQQFVWKVVPVSEGPGGPVHVCKELFKGEVVMPKVATTATQSSSGCPFGYKSQASSSTGKSSGCPFGFGGAVAKRLTQPPAGSKPVLTEEKQCSSSPDAGVMSGQNKPSGCPFAAQHDAAMQAVKKEGDKPEACPFAGAHDAAMAAMQQGSDKPSGCPFAAQHDAAMQAVKKEGDKPAACPFAGAHDAAMAAMQQGTDKPSGCPFAAQHTAAVHATHKQNIPAGSTSAPSASTPNGLVKPPASAPAVPGKMQICGEQIAPVTEPKFDSMAVSFGMPSKAFSMAKDKMAFCFSHWKDLIVGQGRAPHSVVVVDWLSESVSVFVWLGSFGWCLAYKVSGVELVAMTTRFSKALRKVATVGLKDGVVQWADMPLVSVRIPGMDAFAAQQQAVQHQRPTNSWKHLGIPVPNHLTASSIPSSGPGGKPSGIVHTGSGIVNTGADKADADRDSGTTVTNSVTADRNAAVDSSTARGEGVFVRMPRAVVMGIAAARFCDAAACVNVDIMKALPHDIARIHMSDSAQVVEGHQLLTIFTTTDSYVNTPVLIA